jgi:glutathione S-transferase
MAAMSLVMHDLVCLDDRRPSPFCWRIKYALAHKGLTFTARPVAFTDIPQLCGGGYATVPILEDGARVIHDSWAIADYLDTAYPDRPALFATPVERALCRFTEAWLIDMFHHVFPIYVRDIHDHALERDRPYFRESRERRLGRTLEEASADRESRLPAARASLAPLRLMLLHQGQPFIAGAAAGFADYIVAGMLLWIASIGTLPLLTADDPVVAWFERMRDLYGGLGRTGPMHPIVGCGGAQAPHSSLTMVLPWLVQ